MASDWVEDARWDIADYLHGVVTPHAKVDWSIVDRIIRSHAPQIDVEELALVAIEAIEPELDHACLPVVADALRKTLEGAKK